LSGRKQNSSENINNIYGTPAFFMEKTDNRESSSMKKNKLKNGSNNKVAEYRYANDEKANSEFYINNVFPDIGVYDKISRMGINAIENKDRSFTDLIINQKLNFEIINENYQNGKFFLIFIKNSFKIIKYLILKKELETKDNYIETKNNLENVNNIHITNKNEIRNRFELLYEKGKIKNEVNRLMAHKTEEMRMKEELSKCTFYPQTNKNTTFGDKNKNSVEGNFYERLASWQNKIKKK